MNKYSTIPPRQAVLSLSQFSPVSETSDPFRNFSTAIPQVSKRHMLDLWWGRMSDSPWLASWNGQTSWLVELVSSASAKGQRDLVAWCYLCDYKSSFADKEICNTSLIRVFCQHSPVQIQNQFAGTGCACFKLKHVSSWSMFKLKHVFKHVSSTGSAGRAPVAFSRLLSRTRLSKGTSLTLSRVFGAAWPLQQAGKMLCSTQASPLRGFLCRLH